MESGDAMDVAWSVREEDVERVRWFPTVAERYPLGALRAIPPPVAEFVVE